MKALLVIICLIFGCVSFADDNVYKVMKVIDGDTVYLDLNRDGKIQADERVRLNGIDTFEVKPSKGLEWQSKVYKINQNEALGTAYLAKAFAKEKLSGKYVKAVYSADAKYCKRGRHLMSIYYKDDNGNYKNYEEEILKAGLAVVYSQSNLAQDLKPYEDIKKLKKNAHNTKDFKLVILDTQMAEYYSVDCNYAHGKGFYELINLKTDDNGYKKAVCPDN